ncbi:unnamed protein product [Orchesella dallaii]|uniref:Beclin-1-like protein n=1 Tax=Orchesella dallaii TaxID=48710 RepID=A0ABP1Q052_9HEXA
MNTHLLNFIVSLNLYYMLYIYVLTIMRQVVRYCCFLSRAKFSVPLYAPPPLELDQKAVESGVIDKYVPPVNDNENHGFTIVGGSELTSQQSQLLKTHMELFDILSNNTEIDHPLCDECCDTLITLLESEQRASEDECKQYEDFLKKLESESDTEDIEILDAQLKDLKVEETKLVGELRELKVEETNATEALENQRKQFRQLKEQEEEFMKEYCRHKRELNELEDYSQSLDYELRYAEAQSERLEKTNALNATFHIWHSGHFGTINTFRLGRLPSEPVDWNEINAAWGQCALLLNALARKINFKFSNYQIVPFGNHSYIKVLADNSELPLYASGGFSRFLWDTKFDQGMTAFLDCLNQLQAAMLEKPGQSGFALPYRMAEKGRIEDTASGKTYSIKIQLNSEDNWTKALKFMLTNLKWALAWVSSQYVQEEIVGVTSSASAASTLSKAY